MGERFGACFYCGLVQRFVCHEITCSAEFAVILLFSRYCDRVFLRWLGDVTTLFR